LSEKVVPPNGYAKICNRFSIPFAADAIPRRAAFANHQSVDYQKSLEASVADRSVRNSVAERRALAVCLDGWIARLIREVHVMARLLRFWLLSLLAVSVAVLPLRAAEKEEIDKAVTAGADYLKSIQAKDGTWDYEHADGKAGATALAGLALLECGVDPEDPAVLKAVQVVRRLSVELNQTYGLSLCILFLDRLGDPDDVPLIVSMSARLLAGQNSAGAWTYGCPKTGTAEQKRLGEIIKLKAVRPAPQKGEPTKPDDDKPLRDKRDQEAQIKETHARIEAIQRELQPDTTFSIAGSGDNSNTQFAILALWVARRQGVPVENALAKVDARFRSTQFADGGWGYSDIIINPNADPAMTCAGLLGLAAGHGMASLTLLKAKNPDDKDKEPPKETRPKKTPPDPGKDPAVKAGLKALGAFLGDPPAKGKRLSLPGLAGNGGATGNRLYYFLWSVERVAVAYDLNTIGNRDWYGWGAELLVRTQQANGSWMGNYGKGGVDTCFALLFLRRANLARDLTATLKGRVTDPGHVSLKTGSAKDPDPRETTKPEPRDKPPTDTAKEDPNTPPKSAGAPTEAERLAIELVQAAPARQERLLDSLRENKGGVNTQALLAAIPELEGDIKKKARDALAERMSRMTVSTLRDRLSDDNAEMRRASALACAMREEKEHIPRLIELLNDPETHVSRAAYAALKSLSGKDFGPPKDAGRAEIAKAVTAWKAWWKEQGGK
jgi:hypothetical protein